MEPQKPIVTAASTKSVEMARKVWPFVKNDYESGHQWKKEGKPVVWSCALVEKEIYYSMGVYPFFPEQFAALCAVRRHGGSRDPNVEKEGVRFSRIAESHGYPSYLCGYHRVGVGYVINGDLEDAPLGGMPRPDFMITSSTACDVRFKWFEDMARRLEVPLYVLDRPERHEFGFITRRPEQRVLDYYKTQLEDCFSFIENVTGHSFSADKLNEVMDWSYRLNELAQEILELRRASPCPMSCADEFTLMYPWMYKAGTKEAYDFYLQLRDEIRDRVAKRIGVIPEEKFRLMWIGLPNWFNMAIMNYFETSGGVFVRSPEYRALPYPVRNPDDPVGELAYRYLFAGYGAYGMLNNIDEIIKDCEDYHIDGAVLSYLITCRPHAFRQGEVKHILEDLDIPCVSVEGDLVDERTYAESQVKTRLDGMAELILRKKGLQ